MDSSHALKVVSKFFPIWAQYTPDQVNVTPVPGGLMNTVYLVQGPKYEKDPTVPQQVVIRQYGGGPLYEPAIDERRNSPIEENIICFQASNLGIGPQMYGITKDGRIEEFVQSHTLRPSEVLDPQIQKELAHTMATFHTMKIPLSVDKFQTYMNYFRYLFNDLFNDKEQKRAVAPKDHNEAWTRVIEFDFAAELDWLLKVLDFVKSRTVFLFNDDNYSNLLVREDEHKGKSKIAIIDYEWSMNGPRCIDFGTLFANRMFDWSSGIEETGYEILSQEGQCNYINQYIVKLKQLNAFPLDLEGLDSVSHILQEAELGILLHLVMFSGLLLQFASHDNEFVHGPPLFLSKYLKYKQLFLPKYPSWVQLRKEK